MKKWVQLSIPLWNLGKVDKKRNIKWIKEIKRNLGNIKWIKEIKIKIFGNTIWDKWDNKINRLWTHKGGMNPQRKKKVTIRMIMEKDGKKI